MALNHSDPSPDGLNVASLPVIFGPNQPAPRNRWARQLYVGTGGNVVAKTMEGTTITFKNIPNGGLISGWFLAEISAGTTAGDIVVGF